MCCQSCFFSECAVNNVVFPECAANHFFPRICYQSGFVLPESAANHIVSPKCAANLGISQNVLQT
jgi:hypothetical protein